MDNLTCPTLGELLKTQGVISEEQLNQALAEQKSSGRKISQILIDSNFASEEQVAKALATQQGISYVDLNKFESDPTLVLGLSELQSRQFRAMVLEDRGETYLVGMVDPSNVSVQDSIARVLKRPIEVAVITQEHLANAIERLYSKQVEIGEAIQQFQSDTENVVNAIDLSQVVTKIDGEEAPVAKLLYSMFREALRLRASDIHIEPQAKKRRIRYRIDGVLHTHIETDLAIASTLVVKLKLLAGLDISEKRLPQDGRLSIQLDSRTLDVRMSTMPTQHGESVVLRLLIQSQSMRDLAALGMPAEMLERFYRIITAPNGIVLAAGPTGCGKTTTLYGALSRINHPDIKILTCEDPIEYRVAGINQVQVNEKVGLTFPRVLRSFLRQDPDVLLVGEIRDKETAEIAVRAAMTGHMVLSTLHTNDAISAPLRLIDMGVPPYLIAATLRAVLSQRLVRLVCPHCAVPATLTADQEEWLRRFFHDKPQPGKFMVGKGCAHCENTGYYGRIGIFELLEINRELAKALQHGAPEEFETLAREQLGAQSLLHHGMALALEGKTSISEIMKNVFLLE